MVFLIWQKTQREKEKGIQGHALEGKNIVLIFLIKHQQEHAAHLKLLFLSEGGHQPS